MKATHLVAALLLTLLAWSAAGQSPPPADFMPEIANPHPVPAPPPNTLHIVSFNVYYAHQPLQLAENIRNGEELAQADVFLIQEIEDHPSEGSSRTAQLATALELNYVYAPARTTDTGGTHGLAILSRYPLRDVEVIPLPQYDLGHRTRRRIALAATLQVGSNSLRVYNLHLDTRLNLDDRREQLRPVAERARAEAVPRVVVGGDFNTAPVRWLSHSFPIFYSGQAGTVDRFMREHGFEAPLSEAGSTARRFLLGFRLDTIYIRGLQVHAAGVARSVQGSDHKPVWIEVSWP
ncbi:MAG: endonuclease/exonuclease/phosphatase family protein [Terriglobia bacterium]